MPPALLATLFYAAVFAFLFAPVWLGAQSLVHGDSLSVCLPLETLLAEALAQGRLPLWSDALYGGHPIFAEGQGGFAHPLNLLLFGLLPVDLAHGLLHAICAWAAALGTFALCRQLGVGVAAALLGGLLLGTSQAWLDLSGNATIALAAAGTPWVVVALERWWQAPRLASALVLGGSLALVALAGYPQAVHAVALFAGVVLAVRCCQRGFASAAGPYLATAPAVLLAALALPAVQLLPTWELAGLSVRAEGVELATRFDASWHLRGLLFAAGERRAELVAGLGSLLGVGLLATALVVRPGRDVLAYGLASSVLMLLAMGDASPVHGWLRPGLPGLDWFRITWLYGNVAVLGLAVLAAVGLERVGALREATPSEQARAAGAIGVATVAAALLYAPPISPWSFAPLGLALVGVAALWRGGAASHTATLVLAVATVAALLVGRGLLGFVPRTQLAKPPATAAFIAASGREGLVANVPHHFAYLVFSPASAPDLERLVPLFLASLDAGSNLLWGLPSINANLALALERRQQVEAWLEEELRGRSPRPPGRRLVDQLGVRWLLVHHGDREGPYAEDLEEVFFDPESGFHVLENRHARPRLAFHLQALGAEDPAAALAAFQAPTGPPLALEGVRDERRLAAPLGAASARIDVRERASGRIHLALDAPSAGWLFVADAPHPGWRASLDGEPVALHAANVLGKALRVPAGRHEVELAFQPRSVRIGAWITLGALAACGLLLVWEGRR